MVAEQATMIATDFGRPSEAEIMKMILGFGGGGGGGSILDKLTGLAAG